MMKTMDFNKDKVLSGVVGILAAYWVSLPVINEVLKIRCTNQGVNLLADYIFPVIGRTFILVAAGSIIYVIVRLFRRFR